MKAIGERIAELRKARAMTQEELASVIGVSAQSVSKWENSNTMPDISLLPVIAGIFDVSIDSLFDGERKPQNNLSIDDAPEECYRALFQKYVEAWENFNNEKYDPDEFRKALIAKDQNTGAVAYKDTKAVGGVFACEDMALAYLKDEDSALALLDEERIVDLFAALARPSFRKILKYIPERQIRSFTAASLAQKLGLTPEETESELEEMVRLGLHVIEVQDLALDDGETIKCYSWMYFYKVYLMLEPMLTISDRLTGRDFWYSLRG